VEARRRKYGENVLPQEPPPSAFKMLVRQITDYMVLILFVAAIVSFAFKVLKLHI
jgi:Ca2+-transporting ATPase